MTEGTWRGFEADTAMRKLLPFTVLLISAMALTGFGPFQGGEEPICVCTDNGNAGSFYQINTPCNADPVRRVEDNTACSASWPNCALSGSVTAYRCQDSSTVDNCIEFRTNVPGGGSAPSTIQPSTATSAQFSLQAESIACQSNGVGTTRFLQVFYYTANTQNPLACSGNVNAKWEHNWHCHILQ